MTALCSREIWEEGQRRTGEDVLSALMCDCNAVIETVWVRASRSAVVMVYLCMKIGDLAVEESSERESIGFSLAYGLGIHSP
jgi:hypothetical protein